MALAISSGSPKGRKGVCPIHSSSRPAERSSSMPVRMRRGATRFTVIPCSPASLASENVKPSGPASVAAADLFHHLGGLRLAGRVMHADRRAVGRQRQAGRTPDASRSSRDHDRVAP